MNEIAKLTQALTGSEMPEAYNAKEMGKLAKSFQKLTEARVVNNYLIRSFYADDNFYCVYALPLNGTSITDEVLEEIKVAIAHLEYGHMRYDSVQTNSADYWVLDAQTGKHLETYDEEPTGVSYVSDHFDGIVLYTKAAIGASYKKALLKHDIPYVAIGKKKEPSQFELLTITQNALGAPTTEWEYEDYNPNQLQEEQEEQGGSSKYQIATQILSGLIVVGLLIYYFLIK